MITDLDRAHAAMTAGGDAEGMAFYRTLADAELFVVLLAEPQGDTIAPRVFQLTDGPLLLVFDSEERLAGFSADPVPYAALPGRVIAGQILGQGLSLGLNLGTGAASEVVLPPEALDWLTQMLDQSPAEKVEAQVLRFEPPQVPPAVLSALAAILTGPAWLAGVVYQGGRRGVMLAVTGVAAPAEAKMARAVTEALAFSGLEALALDLVFLSPGAAVPVRLAAVALIFGGGTPAPAVSAPLRPPILRQGG